MTRYEFFESGMALTGAKIGIVPIDMLVKYDVYKTYRDLLESGTKKSLALVGAAEKSGCDRSTVARYVYWFEDEPRPTGSNRGNQADFQVPAQIRVA
jgi:hypothetical protein